MEFFYNLDLKGLTKADLAKITIEHIYEFLKLNNLSEPKISVEDIKCNRGCGEYNFRTKRISIFLKSCGVIAHNPGFRWSYPGYLIDREPIGVIAHECGHHIDNLLKYYKHMPHTGKVSNYEPNSREIVAETLKVFILNPDLLRVVCPERYNFLIAQGC